MLGVLGLLGELAPPALGCALELELLESLLLGEAALEPPEAPDFEASLEPDPDGGVAALLDDEEPGADGGVAALLDDEEPGVDAAPPVPPTDADPDVEPEAPEGEEPLGDDALELEEPGVDEVLLALSPPRSHAARPKASATAAARDVSFMCPPWLG